MTDTALIASAETGLIRQVNPTPWRLKTDQHRYDPHPHIKAEVAV